MVQFTQGNILDSPAEALVNAVNTMGVMGKGVALQFKEAFPQNFSAYQQVCKAGELLPGGVFPFKEETFNGSKVIFNFATKKEWFRKSTYAWIEAGLQNLVQLTRDWNIKSLAVPALGCGNGGLDWTQVKPLMEQYLGNLPGVEVWVYEPNESVKGL